MWKRNVFTLSALEPIDTIAGIQARLKSLWFYAGKINGKNSDEVCQAVRAFERDKEIPQKGDPEATTFQDALKEAYGCYRHYQKLF